MHAGAGWVDWVAGWAGHWGRAEHLLTPHQHGHQRILLTEAATARLDAAKVAR